MGLSRSDHIDAAVSHLLLAGADWRTVVKWAAEIGRTDCVPGFATGVQQVAKGAEGTAAERCLCGSIDPAICPYCGRIRSAAARGGGSYHLSVGDSLRQVPPTAGPIADEKAPPSGD